MKNLYSKNRAFNVTFSYVKKGKEYSRTLELKKKEDILKLADALGLTLKHHNVDYRIVDKARNVKKGDK